MLFTFPSRYLFAIGLSGVFSLTRWSWQIQTGFLVSRPTQGTARMIFITCTGLSPPMVCFSKTVPLLNTSSYRSPTTPTLPKQYWFRLFPFRSPLLRESLRFLFLRVLRCFSSPRSLKTGLQPVGLPHSEIFGSKPLCGYPKLIAACHVLHRL